eukprot:scaffold35745_cov35-Attheya_sp.AAC.1
MLHPKHLCVRVGGVCPGKAQRAPAAQGLVLGSDAMVVEQVWGVMGAKIVDISVDILQECVPHSV